MILFLRNLGVTAIPTSRSAVAARRACGDVSERFSLNNISLMALTISVGFVADTAIVLVETSKWGNSRILAFKR